MVAGLQAARILGVLASHKSQNETQSHGFPHPCAEKADLSIQTTRLPGSRLEASEIRVLQIRECSLCKGKA